MSTEFPDPPDPPHYNRPHTYPKFPGNGGSDSIHGLITSPYFMQRSRFLEPTLDQMRKQSGPLWSLFMPGQSVGRPIDGARLKGGQITEAPNTWPPAGAPLRVPKVLFLNSCPPPHLYTKNFTLITKWAGAFRGYFGHHTDSRGRDTRHWSPYYREHEEVPYGSLVFDGYTGGYDYIGWTCDPQNDKREEGRRLIRKYTVVQNPIVTEHERLIEQFRIAKSTLEEKYPGQVFVQVCEFFPAEPVMGIAPHDEMMPKVLDIYSPEGQAANTPTHWCNGPIWMLGPDMWTFNSKTNTNDVAFFGTDFVHFYAGYHAVSGSMTSDGFRYRYTNNWKDLVKIYSWARNTFGYSLDTEFYPGCDQFIASINPKAPGPNPDEVAGNAGLIWNDGYEYNSMEEYAVGVRKLMTNVQQCSAGGGQTRTMPYGKLDMLRLGYHRFAGYRTEIFPYELEFKFTGGAPNFRQGEGRSQYPRGDLVYEDQDWVEQAIIAMYDYRKDQDTNEYSDRYYPGQFFDQADGGGYNFFERYPPTEWYVKDYTPRLQNQFKNLKQILNNLGPKARQLWLQLIEEFSLDELGFNIEDKRTSSDLDADYIVAWAEEYWKLKENAWA